MTSIFGAASTSSQSTPSLFGTTANTAANNSKPNPFLSLNTNTNTTTNSSPFGAFGASASSGSSAPANTATAGKSIFDRITPASPANTTQAPSAPSIFGATATAPASQSGAGKSLFGSVEPAKPANSIFGASTTTQSPQQNTNIFGNMGQQNQQTQQNQGGGLFGNTQNQSGGLLGSTQQKPQGTNLFGASTLAGGGSHMFGQSTNQQIQQQSGQQQGANSLFGGLGGLGQSTQQQQQPGQQGAFGQSILPPNAEIYPRTKPVMEQMETVFLKWHPQSPSSLFQTYLYNNVPPDLAPFYGPTPRDDEAAWEAALRKKPSLGSIPIAVRGFFELGKRVVEQKKNLDILRGRLVEINQGLENLLRIHDLSLTTRTVECRRRHLRLSRRCLSLAAKVQVLKNRGYALDSGEEELRKKLVVLEGIVCDPALSGRGEEIWARMVSIRERGRQLEREFEKAGRNLEKGGEIDEAVFKRCREILDNHSSQISHLATELEQLRKEFAEWEARRRSGIPSER